jgi:PEP-CTERM motif
MMMEGVCPSTRARDCTFRMARPRSRTGANLITGLGGANAGIALDGSGNLFLADGTTIGEYNATTGAAINSNFITGLVANTVIMAIEPASVPEPSSFILLGITLAVVLCGWLLKLRRNPAVS